MKFKRCKRQAGTLTRPLILLGCCLLWLLGTIPAVSAQSPVLISETVEAAPHTIAPSTDALRPTHPVVSYGLRVMAAREEMVFSGLCGQEINLTGKDLCRAMNLSELQYVTITSLPDPEVGTLYVGAVGASEGQIVSAGSLSYLSFAAKEDDKACQATVRLAVNGSGYDVACHFRLLEVLNYTPTVSLAPEISLTVETFADLKTSGTLSSYDPEGDELTYEIVRYASHGRVVLTDRHTGAYTYTPDSGYVGNDAFSYVVRDACGNYSTSAVVQLKVSARPASVTYADVEDHPAAPSILRVSLSGLMNGTRVGGDQYFKPDAAVSRVEFLVTAMHAVGIQSEDVRGLASPSFADAAEIPDAMAPYVSLAVRRGYVTGKMIDGELCFAPEESVTRAEAAVILSNIIGYAKQTTVTAFSDTEAMPAWSVQAMTSLRSFGILMPEDGRADARATMTRGDTALWLDRTLRLISGVK